MPAGFVLRGRSSRRLSHRQAARNLIPRGYFTFFSKLFSRLPTCEAPWWPCRQCRLVRDFTAMPPKASLLMSAFGLPIVPSIAKIAAKEHRRRWRSIAGSEIELFANGPAHRNGDGNVDGGVGQHRARAMPPWPSALKAVLCTEAEVKSIRRRPP